MEIEFKDRTVLITGATRGIGKQLADDFEKLGAELILTGTDRNRIEALNRECANDEELKKRYHCVDFKDQGSMEEFIGVLGGFEKIDVCIN